MRILVTGATGLIGGRFARFALEQGPSVWVSGRHMDAVRHLAAQDTEFTSGDLADPALVLHLREDVEAVVHCADAARVWGPHGRFLATNVGLAESVVEAYVRQKVRRSVHLSSPSVYFDGRDHLDLNEEYAPRHLSNHYGATKYQAEWLVLSVRDLSLEVLALCPRFVIGAGDTSTFPQMIQAHCKGRLRILNNGLNRVDFISVHNLNDMSFGCLLAGGSALGKIYNISDGQPVPSWDAVSHVMCQLDLPPVGGHLLYAVGYGLAAPNEGVYRILPRRPEPMPFHLGMVAMAKNFTLDINRAREYLDYDPRVSLWTALDEFCIQ